MAKTLTGQHETFDWAAGWTAALKSIENLLELLNIYIYMYVLNTDQLGVGCQH